MTVSQQLNQETSVQEGSPPTSAPPAETPEATPPEQPTQQPVAEAQPQTVEEVEAIWKNRVAGKDRAHAATEQSLRDQIAELNTKLAGKAAADAENMTEVERANARAEAAEQRATASENQRVLDIRRVKYAAAAEALDDDNALASMDEAKLAGLNARLTGDETPAPPVIDPNAARRPPSTPPAAPRERSVEDLESDLKRQSPAFLESLNQ